MEESTGTEDRSEVLEAIARVIGRPIDSNQKAALSRFERWLIDEAQPAGGIGPREHERMFDRHIADSLMFLSALDPVAVVGDGIVDVGSGVGLPGIPVAIILPSVPVTLIDRSATRSHLAQRAVRILDLPNVNVITADVQQRHGSFDCAMFRASLPIQPAAAAFLALTHAAGTGTIGVSRQETTPALPSPPSGVAFEMRAVGTDVLDSPFWLLRMRREPSSTTV